MHRAKNLLIIFTLWQMTTAQENCPGVKLSAGLGSLLGNIPISNCAPDLPLLPDLACGPDQFLRGLPGLPCGRDEFLGGLPELPCGRDEFLGGFPGFPGFPCGPSLPSLPYGDCGCPPSFPCLPELPCLDNFYDYPCFGEPLPYFKKKLGCGCLAKKACLAAKCGGCGLGKCLALKECCLKEKEECGLGLKIVPLIKPFPLLKKKKFECYDGLESLPCEIPHLVSGAVRGSLCNNGYY